jgi:hypothetical protein
VVSFTTQLFYNRGNVSGNSRVSDGLEDAHFYSPLCFIPCRKTDAIMLTKTTEKFHNRADFVSKVGVFNRSVCRKLLLMPRFAFITNIVVKFEVQLMTEVGVGTRRLCSVD